MSQDTDTTVTYGWSRFQVDKLTLTNYVLWKTNCKIVLFKKKLWKYVDLLKHLPGVPTETNVENQIHAFNCIWMRMSKSEQKYLQNITNP